MSAMTSMVSLRYYIGVEPWLQISDMDMLKEIAINHFGTSFTNRTVGLPDAYKHTFMHKYWLSACYSVGNGNKVESTKICTFFDTQPSHI